MQTLQRCTCKRCRDADANITDMQMHTVHRKQDIGCDHQAVLQRVACTVGQCCQQQQQQQHLRFVQTLIMQVKLWQLLLLTAHKLWCVLLLTVSKAIRHADFLAEAPLLQVSSAPYLALAGCESFSRQLAVVAGTALYRCHVNNGLSHPMLRPGP